MEVERQSLVKEYRELLRRSASVEALDASLRLLERVGQFAIRTPGVELELQSLSVEEQNEENITRGWRDYMREFAEEELEQNRRRRSTKRQALRLTELAAKTTAALALTTRLLERHEPPVPDDRFSLAVDTCFLVFHHAYFALIPRIKDDTDRRNLIQSFAAFSTSLASKADQLHIRALAVDLMGAPQLAAQYHEAAAFATNPSDHDFMTAVQTCWSYLVDHGWYRRGLDFLLGVYPHVKEQDLPEIRDMVLITYELVRPGKKTVIAR